jgi:hypothetical protein
MTSLLSMNFNGNTVKDWIKSYNHQVNDNQVMLEGVLTPIDKVFDRVINKDTNKISSNWRYDYRGFTNTSFIKFKELTKTHQHEADGNFYFVIKSKEKRIAGISKHIYMELIDNQGDGYSVGLCGSMAFPFYGRRGAIVSPDPKEASNEGERKTYIKLTQEQFLKLKKRIEKEKAEGNEYFHVIKRNCSKFVSSICNQELGIKMNNKEFLSQALARKIFAKLNITPSEKTLKIFEKVAKVFRVALFPLYGLIYLALLAPFDSNAAKSIKTKGIDESKGFIENFKSIINGDFIKPYSAWKVANWQDHVLSKFGTNKISLEQAQEITCPSYVNLDQPFHCVKKPT